jgi:hypothetical protein
MSGKNNLHASQSDIVHKYTDKEIGFEAGYMKASDDFESKFEPLLVRVLKDQLKTSDDTIDRIDNIEIHLDPHITIKHRRIMLAPYAWWIGTVLGAISAAILIFIVLPWIYKH